MIVMRIGKLPGKCQITGYETGGWFPIDGFNFGFNVNMDDLSEAIANEKDQRRRQRTQDESQQTPEQAPRQVRGARSDDDGADEGITKMQISKAVDGTTVYLMRHAMEQPPKPGETTKLDAEINVVGSMIIKQEQTVYCWLRVYLQDVFITSWEVNGAGDGRPIETVELQYGKGAMCYQGSQGGFLDPAQEDGWNLWENKRWRHYQGLAQTL
jgi:type VI protein secretion system component Hcp